MLPGEMFKLKAGLRAIHADGTSIVAIPAGGILTVVETPTMLNSHLIKVRSNGNTMYVLTGDLTDRGERI